MLDTDFKKIADLSIPLRFGGGQPNAYGVESAISEACEYGVLVGDTRRGGSCNFERVTMITHCNGTHTECVGHITNERLSVRECLQDILLDAVLISVEPEPAGADKVISLESLRSANATIPMAAANDGRHSTALIVRTLPNDESKLSREYGDDIPPYFAAEAMEYIVKRGFKHLLVDLPSIDRLYDDGKLTNHRIFWNVGAKSFEIDGNSRVSSTITELIYVPNEVEDGLYLLNLQIAPFDSDASPSRPILLQARQ